MRGRPFFALGAAVSFLMLAACSSAPVGPAESAPEPAEAVMPVSAIALSCSGCHGPSGGAMASLNGRTAEQVRQSLLMYKEDTEGSSVMHRMMRGYTEADIDAISQYLGEDVPE